MSRLIELFGEHTGLSEFDLRRIIDTAPDRYKTYRIPKRVGGFRTISQPARELKVLQRVLVESIISHLPVHPAATAYRPGLSIRDNASVHAGTGAILKFDFEDFFPSIRAVDWQQYCLRAGVFENPKDVSDSCQILFRRSTRGSALRLAIGAPSSPALSNVLMFDFDKAVSSSIANQNVRFTRYADDLTFSAPRTGYLNGVEKDLRKIVADCKHPRLSIKNEKTVLATTKYKRMVTGLILSNDGRVTIGRSRKRLLRVQLRSWSCGELSEAQRMELSGLLSFIKDVEPGYFRELCEKFGSDIIRAVRVG